MFQGNILPNDPQMADYKINKKKRRSFKYVSERFKGCPFDWNSCLQNLAKKYFCRQMMSLSSWPTFISLKSLYSIWNQLTLNFLLVQINDTQLKWKLWERKKKLLLVTAFYYYFFRSTRHFHTKNLSENVRAVTFVK